MSEQGFTMEEAFEREFQATIPRYLSKPGVNVDLQLRNKETDEVMRFAAAFPEQFENWKTIQSLPDRR